MNTQYSVCYLAKVYSELTITGRVRHLMLDIYTQTRCLTITERAKMRSVILDGDSSWISVWGTTGISLSENVLALRMLYPE